MPWKNKESHGVDRAQSSWYHKFYCSAVRVINDFTSSSFTLFQGHWISLSKNNLWIVAFIKWAQQQSALPHFPLLWLCLGPSPGGSCRVISALSCPTGRAAGHSSIPRLFLTKQHQQQGIRGFAPTEWTVLKVRFPEVCQWWNMQIIKLIYSWKSSPASFHIE